MFQSLVYKKENKKQCSEMNGNYTYQKQRNPKRSKMCLRLAKNALPSRNAVDPEEGSSLLCHPEVDASKSIFQIHWCPKYHIGDRE